MSPKMKDDVPQPRIEFSWHVSASYMTLLGLTGIPIREFNLNPDACIEAYRKGRPMIRERFGDQVGLPGVATPPVSYGHADGLGGRLIFPENGEVAVEPVYASLAQGIQALKKPVDFSKAGMAPFFLDFLQKLKNAFPGEVVEFGYGLEGPLTTAYEVRGQDFFYDLADDPKLVKEFLHLLTDSILQFHRFICEVQGRPSFSPDAAGMADDIAGMVSPNCFSEFVIPFWDQYFRGKTSGKRSAHVENLCPEQLKFLEEIGLSWFDPGISPKLNPRVITEGCRIPFGWRLPGFRIPYLTGREIEDFVFQAVADGASSVFTDLHDCWDLMTVEKINAFVRAAKEVKRMADHGASRKDIVRH
jgi:hypothetical protein